MAGSGKGGGGSASTMAKWGGRHGHSVQVTRKVKPHADGSTAIELSINLEGVAVPERRYAADVVHIKHDGEVIFVMFGQTSFVTERLRSLVVVKLFAESVRRFLHTTTENEDFAPKLAAFIDRNKIIAPKLRPLTAGEPEHVVALAANVFAAGYTGREAVLDFYHVNALALVRLNKESDLSIDPIVRVDLPTSLLVALMSALDSLKTELPPEAI